jgi:hypothetical protein
MSGNQTASRIYSGPPGFETYQYRDAVQVWSDPKALLAIMQTENHPPGPCGKKFVTPPTSPVMFPVKRLRCPSQLDPAGDQ